MTKFPGMPNGIIMFIVSFLFFLAHMNGGTLAGERGREVTRHDGHPNLRMNQP